MNKILNSGCLIKKIRENGNAPNRHTNYLGRKIKEIICDNDYGKKTNRRI